MRFYDSQTQAMQRVERLKDEAGYWPGVIGPDPQGRYRLTYDPDLAVAHAAKADTQPEPPTREQPERKTTGRKHPAPQSELETGPSEADLDQADAWLEDDLQQGPETEEFAAAHLTEADVEAELKAGLSLEADWGL